MRSIERRLHSFYVAGIALAINSAIAFLVDIYTQHGAFLVDLLKCNPYNRGELVFSVDFLVAASGLLVGAAIAISAGVLLQLIPEKIEKGYLVVAGLSVAVNNVVLILVALCYIFLVANHSIEWFAILVIVVITHGLALFVGLGMAFVGYFIIPSIS